MGEYLQVTICFLILSVLVNTAPDSNADNSSSSVKDGLPEGISEKFDPSIIKQTGEHTYQLGNLRIDSKSRQIEFPAAVNMREGLIEVVICTAYGKTHESIFVTPASPLHVHIALLLLGLKPGRNPGWYESPETAESPDESDTPVGDMVDVYATWGIPEGKRKVRVESLLEDIRTDEALPAMGWVFIGSLVDRGGAYVAQSSGSILTNYHDRTSVLDNPLETGRIDDYTYARTEEIPPIGADVLIHIVPAKKQKGEGDD
ncbi:MAG: YdjY domain-containing protein [Candidatus Hydrogenedentes bacterium]|nr:YdjY domain-containing protein [Candidatus Hydrogenedentota bacterium]